MAAASVSVDGVVVLVQFAVYGGVPDRMEHGVEELVVGSFHMGFERQLDGLRRFDASVALDSLVEVVHDEIELLVSD